MNDLDDLMDFAVRTARDAGDVTLRHDTRPRRSRGPAEGWDVAGGHPRFSRKAPMPPERVLPNPARSQGTVSS